GSGCRNDDGEHHIGHRRDGRLFPQHRRARGGQQLHNSVLPGAVFCWNQRCRLPPCCLLGQVHPRCFQQSAELPSGPSRYARFHPESKEASASPGSYGAGL
ncbi:unnamed protein product, partial [Symbiodinium pilosum]